MTVLLTLKTVERALKYSNHSTSSKNHRCFLNFETTPEFRYLGEKQKKKWTSWKYWEWSRYSTAKSSRTATGIQVVICHFGGIYETSKIHKFCLRVRAREVQNIWAVIMSWTWAPIVVTVNAVTGFPGDFWKSQSVFLIPYSKEAASEQPTYFLQPQNLLCASDFLWLMLPASDWEKWHHTCIIYLCSVIVIDHQMLFIVFWQKSVEGFSQRKYFQKIFTNRCGDQICHQKNLYLTVVPTQTFLHMALLSNLIHPTDTKVVQVQRSYCHNYCPFLNNGLWSYYFTHFSWTESSTPFNKVLKYFLLSSSIVLSKTQPGLQKADAVERP